MRRYLLLLFLIALPVGNVVFGTLRAASNETSAPGQERCMNLYSQIDPDGRMNYAAFERAFTGFYNIGGKRKEILTLIDFTRPSTEERLYVIDMLRKELLFSSHVSHGRNSGGNYATSFSNDNGSHKSSLGFYLTGFTYQGRNGYSMTLDGLEKGVNDRARERAIVMHGADYADPEFISSNGRLGRSFGCPALPRELNREVIDTIKEGSVLFIYAEDRTYLTGSSILSLPKETV